MTKMVFVASMLATFFLSPSAFANDTYKQEVEALKAQKERQQAAISW